MDSGSIGAAGRNRLLLTQQSRRLTGLHAHVSLVRSVIKSHLAIVERHQLELGKSGVACFRLIAEAGVVRKRGCSKTVNAIV